MPTSLRSPPPRRADCRTHRSTQTSRAHSTSNGYENAGITDLRRIDRERVAARGRSRVHGLGASPGPGRGRTIRPRGSTLASCARHPPHWRAPVFVPVSYGETSLAKSPEFYRTRLNCRISPTWAERSARLSDRCSSSGLGSEGSPVASATGFIADSGRTTPSCAAWHPPYVRDRAGRGPHQDRSSPMSEHRDS